MSRAAKLLFNVPTLKENHVARV